MRIAGKEFTAALFDVDGTLIDSNDAHAQAWIGALRDHGIDADMSHVRPLIGMGGDKLLRQIASLEEDSTLGRRITQRKKQIFEQLLPDLLPTAGAQPLLEVLRDRRVTIGVATSADDHELDQLLKQAGVDGLIHQHASKDDAGESKPDPDIVHAALTRTRSRAEETVMIGDTPYDIEAAGRTGVATIALRCGGYWSDSDLRGAMAIFDNPADLLSALRGA